MQNTEQSKVNVTRPINPSATVGTSDWYQQVDRLAGELEKLREMRPGHAGHKWQQASVHASLWDLTMWRARIVLRTFGWQGDITQDAQDIASGVHQGLIGQERRGAGIFAPFTPEGLRKYLSKSICQGVKQQISHLLWQRRLPMVHDQDAMMQVVAPRRNDWQLALLRVAMQVERAKARTKGLPKEAAGKTSIGQALALALDRKSAGKGIKLVLPCPDMPKRSRQRCEQQFREAYKRELEI